MNDADERRARHADSSKLRHAADALNENKARLRQTGAELRERERELDRTGDLVRDVERSTRALRSSKPPTPKPEAEPATDQDADEGP